MVDRSYLLEQPPPPGRWKRALDLVVLPRLIDGASAAERAAARLATQARRRPMTGLGVALGAGVGAGLLMFAGRARL